MCYRPLARDVTKPEVGHIGDIDFFAWVVLHKAPGYWMNNGELL